MSFPDRVLGLPGSFPNRAAKPSIASSGRCGRCWPVRPTMRRAVGFVSGFDEATADALHGVTLTDGRLVVDFNDAIIVNNMSTSTGMVQFNAELHRNVFLHPEVDSVEFHFNGDCAAWSALFESDGCRVISRADWNQISPTGINSAISDPDRPSPRPARNHPYRLFRHRTKGVIMSLSLIFLLLGAALPPEAPSHSAQTQQSAFVPSRRPSSPPDTSCSSSGSSTPSPEPCEGKLPSLELTDPTGDLNRVLPRSLHRPSACHQHWE